jgi:peptidoglycan/LPS O-acetylase OafA/YrhL
MLGLGGLTGLSVAGVRPAQASVGAVALTLVVLAAMTADFLLRGSTSRSVLAFPFFMASIYVFIFQNQTSLLVRALDFGPIRGLGRISYGFYLYHNFVKLEWIRPLIGISFEPSNKIRVAIEFLITLLVAVLSWFVIERPLLRRFSRPHLISNSLETIQQASQPAQ